MKRIVTVAILVSVCMFWSCTKNNSPNVETYELAAIVKDAKSGKLILEVLYDVILIAPGVSDESLENGDLLWVKFNVEEDKQTYKDTTLVSGIIYRHLGNSVAKPATDSASDFDCPIHRTIMWLNNARNFWVFGFEQIASTGQTFDYELQFGRENDDIHPTVYLRSKKTNSVSASNTVIFTNFGFDLTPLIDEYANVKSSTLTFRVKYMSGFDDKGNEEFTSFQQEFVTVNVKKTETLGRNTQNIQ